MEHCIYKYTIDSIWAPAGREARDISGLKINYSLGFGRGGGQELFFIDLGIYACREARVSGGMLPGEKNLNGAIWCVLGCILIRFCLYFFSEITIFIYIYI